MSRNNLTGLFAQLNQAISENPLNKQWDFGVEGEPSRPMDRVNPMLSGAVQKIGGAAGVKGLETSEQAVEARKIKHRAALTQRARNLGLEDVAKGLEAGGDVKDYLAQIMQAEEREKDRADTELAYRRQVEQADAQVLRDIKLAEAKGDIQLANTLKTQKAQHELTRSKIGYTTVGGEVMATDGHGKIIGPVGLSEREHARIKEEEADAQEAALKEYQDLENAAERSADVQADINTLKRDVQKAGGTGLTTLGASFIPSTASGTARATMKQMQAKMTLDVMAAMKAMSKTGATGFGQLSEKELAVLQDAITSLNLGMSTETFNRQLAQIERDYAEVRKEWEARGGAPKVSVREVPNEGPKEVNFEDL